MSMDAVGTELRIKRLQIRAQKMRTELAALRPPKKQATRNTLTRVGLDHILKIYAEEGPAAARLLAPQYGINPKYVRNLASVHRVKAKLKHPPVSKYKRYPDAIDPRWKWAIERGPVFA